jgi:hypothetical protein
LDSLKKQLGDAQQKTRLVEFCARAFLDWMARYAPEGLEEIHQLAHQSIQDVLGDDEKVAMRVTLMNMITTSSWERAIAAGKLDCRIDQEVALMIATYPGQDPSDLAARVEAQDWHPAGAEVQARVAAGLRAKSTKTIQ